MRPYVAVATEEGILINQHLGETRTFQIWEQVENSYHKVEERPGPAIEGGINHWHQLAKIFGDCRAVLVSGIGQTPLDILSKSGVKPVEAAGFIENGLGTVYENKNTSSLKSRKTSCADGCCSGSVEGCG